jgi:hypothetical protein
MTDPEDSEQPIFALDPSANWDDIDNAIAASVQYQSEKRGMFGPMFAFAPMTEPQNPDKWEPLQTPPKNLLVASIERSEDKRLLKAFKQAQIVIGPLLHESPNSPVQIHFDRLLADVYRQMEEAGLIAFCHVADDKDDPSFFFLRGTEGILAVNAQLRTLKTN